MEVACRCEIDILSFWELTPSEIRIAISGYTKKLKEEQEERLTLVYLNNVWNPYRTKRLPNLNKLLNNEKKENKMENADMLDEIKKINAMMGGTVY